MIVKLLFPRYLYIRRNLGSACAVTDRERQIGLYPNLIPQVLHQERTECLGTTFDDQRLDMMGVQTIQIQGVGMVDD